MSNEEKPMALGEASNADADVNDANGRPTAKVDGAGELDRILDVTVALTVELGRRRIRISEALSLAPGSVVEFPKSADEPLDIRINDQLVARGEAVVIGERYGVRVTEVVSPNERLRTSGLIKEMSA